MLEMSVSNRQIVIAGRVLAGETKKTISGAIVEIIEMPATFQTQLSLKKLQYGWQWEKMNERPDRKITTKDGYFHFINLPPGEYVLETSFPSSNSGYIKAKKILQVFSPVNGKISTTMTDIVISSVEIKGTITDIKAGKKE